MTAALDIALVALLVGIAAWTTLARHALTAAIVFVVYGLVLAIAWVRLAAIDVALTEAAIGSGITGLLLLDASARVQDETTDASRSGTSLRFLAAMLCALVSAGLAATALFLPDTAPTLAPSVVAHLPDSGLGNPVAGVLFVYRAFDTLLEKVVVVLALVGVWSLAPDRLWGEVPGLRRYVDREGMLVFLARILPPVGIVFAIYMCWAGADRPGGAFQGGTVLAAMWLLVLIAGLEEVPAISRTWLRVLLVVGPVVFLGIGFAGSWLAGAFLAYPPGYAKPLIVAAEVALTISLGATLALLAAGPPGRMQPP